jgi:hypothetical protein
MSRRVFVCVSGILTSDLSYCPCNNSLGTALVLRECWLHAFALASFPRKIWRQMIAPR